MTLPGPSRTIVVEPLEEPGTVTPPAPEPEREVPAEPLGPAEPAPAET